MHSYKKKYKVSTRPAHTEDDYRWTTLDNVGSIKTRRMGYTAAYEHLAMMFREIDGTTEPQDTAADYFNRAFYAYLNSDQNTRFSSSTPTEAPEETPAERQTRRGLVNPNRRARGYGNTNGYRF